MHLAWQLREPATARTLYEQVIEEHPVAIHTVITVLNKLVAKGLLYREKQPDLLHFYPRVTEQEYREYVSRHLVEGVLSLGHEDITRSFVDVLSEQDPERLRDLATQILQRIEEGEGGA